MTPFGTNQFFFLSAIRYSILEGWFINIDWILKKKKFELNLKFINEWENFGIKRENKRKKEKYGKMEKYSFVNTLFFLF